MAFELGETYSGYKFLDVSKRTRNGVEYRVQNTFAQRVEILRMLPETAQGDQEQTERFLREVRVRARLVHQNIVTLFNAVELGRQLAMTTELVEGISLAERLKLGPMPWREALNLFRQALAAAGFAHDQQVVHRDINPDNILITPGEILKLTNFGLAKMAASPKLTQVGAVLGNLKYISPEQVKGTGEADGRSDLYSLGAVFYEMLCGRPPFDSQSQFELMAAHVNETPKPPSAWNSQIPAALDAVVLKSIAKDRADRYQTAQEFAEALAQVERAGEPRPTAEAAPAAAPVAAAPAIEARPEPVARAAERTMAGVPAFLAAVASPRITLSWFFFTGAAAACFLLFMVLWFSSK
jgi:eukaryotic-like serine/threonine-protein kinase